MVRQRWDNKIDNLRKMFYREDDYLQLQSKIREENIKIRNARIERLKQKEKDRFQEIRKEGLKKKAQEKRKKEDKRMENAIISTWININTQPIQVSFAIDAVLETAIEEWAQTRLIFILETIVTQVKEHGFKTLSAIKARNRDLGIPDATTFKASDPYGRIYRPDVKEKRNGEKKCKRKKGNEPKQTSKETSPTQENQDEKLENEIELFNTSPAASNSKIPMTVVPNYVHYGPVTVHSYQLEYELENKLKPVAGRPKTPMPTPEELCEAGFLEEKLKDVLPTLDDELDMKEKRKFRKTFKSVGIQLYKRAASITKIALEPVTTFRAVNKLVYLGETERKSLVNTLCYLIMNKNEKTIYETEEFDRLAKAVAREVIKEILNPLELRKEEDDGVARTKIMFYTPKPKKFQKPR